MHNLKKPSSRASENRKRTVRDYLTPAGGTCAWGKKKNALLLGSENMQVATWPGVRMGPANVYENVRKYMRPKKTHAGVTGNRRKGAGQTQASKEK